MENSSVLIVGSRFSQSTASTLTMATDAFEQDQITKLILLTFIIVIGLVGNLLVCVAIIKSPKLRKVVNYFVLSLAISDLLVCTLVMPLAIYQEVTGKWKLGIGTCYLWILSDVLLCTASIWNLCLVSIDRYFAITRPIKYAKYRTLRNAILAVLSIWFVSLVIAIVLVFVPIASQPTHAEDEVDLCQVHSEPAVSIISVLAAFFIPCFIISLLYVRIFIVIKSKVSQPRSNRSNVIAYDAAKAAQRQSSVYAINRANSIEVLDKTSTSEPSSDRLSTSKAQSLKRGPSALKKRWTVRRLDSITIKREMKTAVVLAIVVGAFFVCWLPYFIIYLVMLWKDNSNVQAAFQVATWLGWCNSLINPLIYTIFNEDFRETFKEIIFCGKLNKREFKLYR